MNLSRRNFLVGAFATVASFILGRCDREPVSYACIPKDQDAAPAPDLDLAKEFRSSGCLTRDDLDRVAEIAQERACPAEPMAFGDRYMEHQNAHRAMLRKMRQSHQTRRRMERMLTARIPPWKE